MRFRAAEPRSSSTRGPGCHLCEEALEAIVALHEEGYRFELREVDIESDDALLRRLLERIPVVEIDGEVVSELRPRRGTALRARLDTVGAMIEQTDRRASSSERPDRSTASGSRSASPRASRATCRC